MRRGQRIFGLARARLIVVLIALIAFTAQTYLVQTHIHTATTAITAGIAGPAGHKVPGSDKDNPDDCPICQALAMAGSFVTPALIILALALSVIDASPFFALRTSSGPLLARNWRSRAPPQH